MNKLVIDIERTKGKGLPALWESGGGYTNTGGATIITGPAGEPLRPYYIKRRGHLACGNHALVPLRPGFFVVKAGHHRGDFWIGVYRVVDITDDKATLEAVAEFDEGAWDREPPAFLLGAIEAAKGKAKTYHARHAVYIALE